MISKIHHKKSTYWHTMYLLCEHTPMHTGLAWLSGSMLVLINGVTVRWARLILGPSTGKPSWYNQPPRSTQPFILPGSINEYRQYAGVKTLVAGNTV